jgi:O-antigen ligase
VLAVVIILAAAVPILSKGSRAEWQRRFAGVTAAVNKPSGAECTAEQAADPATDCTVADREIRLLYYQQGEKLLIRRPVLGYGIGQFGGIVAYQNDPNWNEDPRFQPVGFNKYNFAAKTVDAFWLHLVVEAGLLGMIAYLVWLWFLAQPLVRELRPRRGQPRQPRAPGHPALYWAPAAVLFVTLIAWLSASLEDPLVPPLLFTIVGIGWVVLARGNQAAPVSGSGPRHTASGRHAADNRAATEHEA